MEKGWALVSLYPKDHQNPNSDMYFHFTHYTGKHSKTGGSEHDQTLDGTVTEEQLRRAVRKFLTLKKEVV